MKGHPLAKQLEEWHRQHNGRHDSPEWQAFLQDFSQLIATKVDELGEEHDNDGKFGMSKAGGCTRAVALKWLGEKPDEISGSSRVTFFIGHLVECLAIASLRAVGVDVRDSQANVSTEFWHSYTDGVIPDFEGQLTLLSVKSAGYKKSGKERVGREWKWVRRGFPELPFHGVAKAQPGHYAQMQAEMYAYGASQSLYVVVSKDIIKSMEGDPYLGPEGNGSLAFYVEKVVRNDAYINHYLLPVWKMTWENAQRGNAGEAWYATNDYRFTKLAVANENWAPNAERTGTFNPCNYCDMLTACRNRLATEFSRR